MKREKYSGLNKGSMTVEAAFVVPLSLVVIFMLLSLTFYLHNWSWYTAATGETAITAAGAAVCKNGNYQEILREKEALFRRGSGFPEEYRGIKSNVKDQEIEIFAEVKVVFLIGKGNFSAKVRSIAKIIRPVNFIRKIQALELLKG